MTLLIISPSMLLGTVDIDTEAPPPPAPPGVDPVGGAAAPESDDPPLEAGGALFTTCITLPSTSVSKKRLTLWGTVQWS